MSAYEGGQNHLPDIPAERWREMYEEAAAEIERLRADLARAEAAARAEGAEQMRDDIAQWLHGQGQPGYAEEVRHRALPVEAPGVVTQPVAASREP